MRHNNQPSIRLAVASRPHQPCLNHAGASSRWAWMFNVASLMVNTSSSAARLSTSTARAMSTRTLRGRSMMCSSRPRKPCLLLVAEATPASVLRQTVSHALRSVCRSDREDEAARRAASESFLQLSYAAE